MYAKSCASESTERQKADRLVKKLRKQLIEATNSNEISTLKNELHVAEVDADYARHFPLLERYVSLYPQTISGKEQRPGEAGDGQDGSGKDPEDRFDAQGMAEVALHAPRPPLWATIEKIREEGRGALEKLRDRRTDIKPKRSQSERKSKEILARKSDVTQVKRTKQTYASEQTSALSNRASRRADRDQQHRRHANPQAARHGGTTGGDSDGDGFFEAA